jgi:hypothetical protein
MSAGAEHGLAGCQFLRAGVFLLSSPEQKVHGSQREQEQIDPVSKQFAADHSSE